MAKNQNCEVHIGTIGRRGKETLKKGLRAFVFLSVIATFFIGAVSMGKSQSLKEMVVFFPITVIPILVFIFWAMNDLRRNGKWPPRA